MLVSEGGFCASIGIMDKNKVACMASSNRGPMPMSRSMPMCIRPITKSKYADYLVSLVMCV